MRVYGASRVKHAAMWRALRDAGEPIISSWIDEAGDGETASLSELWSRIDREVSSSDIVILYAETEDFPLKGALVEAGMAIAAGIPVLCVLPNVELETRTLRPLGSWAQHPLVEFRDSIVDALTALTRLPPPEPQRVPWTLSDAINHMSHMFREKCGQRLLLRAIACDREVLYLAMNRCVGYHTLLKDWEWSKDGEHWWPCGTSVTDTPSS